MGHIAREQRFRRSTAGENARRESTVPDRGRSGDESRLLAPEPCWLLSPDRNPRRRFFDSVRHGDRPRPVIVTGFPTD